MHVCYSFSLSHFISRHLLSLLSDVPCDFPITRAKLLTLLPFCHSHHPDPFPHSSQSGNYREIRSIYLIGDESSPRQPTLSPFCARHKVLVVDLPAFFPLVIDVDSRWMVVPYKASREILESGEELGRETHRIKVARGLDSTPSM